MLDADRNNHGDRGTIPNEIVSLCETILANVIAFEEVGVPLRELEHHLARDGGMLLGRGMLFHTPVDPPLSKEHGRMFFETYRRLLEVYVSGRLDPARMNRLRELNIVPDKVSIMRETLRKQG